MGLFDGAGKQAGADAVDKLRPILSESETRLENILHGLLDRLKGAKITLTFEIPDRKP